MQPDILVARFDQLTDKNLPTAPVLAVEVLSRSGRLIDLNLKHAAYERMGTPSYWMLDPGVPNLLVLELDADSRYQEVAQVVGDEAFETHRPFTVHVVPIELLGRLDPTERASHRYGRLTPPLPYAYRHLNDGMG